MKFLYFLALQILRFWSMLTGIKYYGRENIEKVEGSAVLLANHCHVFDPIFMGVACRYRQVNFVAKIELFSNKLVAHIMKMLDVIGVDRDNMDLSTMREILGRLKNGKLIGIFPEGTRNNGTDMLPFKQGALVMASKGKATIVPMGIVNAENLFKFWRPRPYVIIGEPYKLPEGRISTEELDVYNQQAAEKVYALWKQPIDKVK